MLLSDMSGRDRAVIFMILASLSFAVMQTAVKVIPDIPVFEKVLVRNLVSLFMAAGIAAKKKTSLFASGRKAFVLLVLRSFCGLSGVFLIFYAIQYLTIAEASIFIRLSPFWVALLSALFLKESLTKTKAAALIIAFSGALLIIRPGFIPTGGSYYAALGAGLLASLMAGGAYIFVSVLKKYEKPETIVFFFSLISVLIMLPFTIAAGVMPDAGEGAALLIIGVSAGAGQMFLTNAYRLGKASEVSIYNYTGILFAVLIDLIIWQNRPSLFTLLGGVLVVTAGFMVYRASRREAEAKR
ncbi:MAG: DMT family transporter [Fibrobacterota bacterium]